MSKKNTFFMSAAVIASAGIFLRCVAISFNAYVSAKIGSESMGLFTLVMSVYGLAVTVATSGVNLAAVRLTSERTALLSKGGADTYTYRSTVGNVIKACTLYSLAFSVVASLLLYALSPFIGKCLLADIRTVSSLKILAFSLPPISLCSALSGCFTGLRKSYKNALSAVAEQFVKIVIISTALALSYRSSYDFVEYSCLAVVGGGAAAEAFSLILNLLMYFTDNKRPVGVLPSSGNTLPVSTAVRDAAEISLPIAAASYARQGLSTAEHLAIPWGLRRSGMSAASALSSYGKLLGMIFPLILFPSVVLTSAAGLLIPELAELRTLGRSSSARRLIDTALTSSVIYSVCCAFVFFIFADELGVSVYASTELGHLIRCVAPLVPIMYTDTVTDCILKGIGEQKACMRINVIDSLASFVLALLLVPALGLKGYVISVYFCEILNFMMSIFHLKKCAGIGIGVVSSAVLSVISGFVSLTVHLFLSHKVPAAVYCEIILFISLYAMQAVIFARITFGKVKKEVLM